MGHVAFRATSPEALERRVAVIEGIGLGKGWTDGDLGHGPRLSRSRDPTATTWSSTTRREWYEAPPELKPALKNQAQRFPARGCNVRRLDHLNLLAVDVARAAAFFEEVSACARPRRSCSTTASRRAPG